LSRVEDEEGEQQFHFATGQTYGLIV